MPRYIYFCENCNEEFEQYHPISTIILNCPKCESEKIFRVYKTDFNLAKEKLNEKKVGQEVHKFIKESKEELLEYKKQLKNKDNI